MFAFDHKDEHFQAPSGEECSKPDSIKGPPPAIVQAKSSNNQNGGYMKENGAPFIYGNPPVEAQGDIKAPENVAVDGRPTGRAGRRKKRKVKKNSLAALCTVRGFTPATSADEDSDFSTEGIRTRDLSTQRSSSIVRKDIDLTRSDSPVRNSEARATSSNGFSALTRQLSGIDFGNAGPRRASPMRTQSRLGQETSSSAGNSSGPVSDNEDAVETTSYEVPLEHDFISRDAPQDDTSGEDFLSNHVHRKMSAQDFEPLRCLGKGTYGTVLLVKQAATGKLYAQKQFRKASLTVRKALVEQTKTERTILESINSHPFVVKLYYAFQDHEKLYLILEYAQGGELFTRMLTERMFPEETAAFYMAEMVLALSHLHTNVGVLYRDLKPENCLLDAEGHLLLTDFGLSKVAVDGCRSMTGTLEYMAPEVIMEQSYGAAVDWWSLGILGFDLLTGSSPFYANNETQIRSKILKAKLTLPYFLSLDAKDILTRFLRKEPKKRLGANMPKDLQAIKSHRFFRKIDWKALERRELEPPIQPLVTDPELAENFASEFTGLAVSPVKEKPLEMEGVAMSRVGESVPSADPFGGFSFVASRSLLEAGGGFV